MNSVDLSTYGLEMVKLNQAIGLDESETELDPQHPNPSGLHGKDELSGPLDLIIQSFNENWYQGRDERPEDQRIKFVNLSKKIMAHPEFEMKVKANMDIQNKDLAFKRILDEVMSQQRKNELDLYRLYAKAGAFYQAFFDTMKGWLMWGVIKTII